jgi:hypothetical protein
LHTLRRPLVYSPGKSVCESDYLTIVNGIAGKIHNNLFALNASSLRPAVLVIMFPGIIVAVAPVSRVSTSPARRVRRYAQNFSIVRKLIKLLED